MREILFRGKRVTDRKWITGSLMAVSVNAADYHFIFGPEFRDNGSEMTAMSHALVDPDTVGQYTGVLDRNGRRIFEGDILKSQFEDFADDTTAICYDEVFWCPNEARWGLRSMDRSGSCDDYLHAKVGDYAKAEVVGTIFDDRT